MNIVHVTVFKTTDSDSPFLNSYIFVVDIIIIIAVCL